MSHRPDWNLFSPNEAHNQPRRGSIAARRALHGAANLDEAQRILADAECTGETGIRVEWARDVLARASEGRGRSEPQVEASPNRGLLAYKFPQNQQIEVSD